MARSNGAPATANEMTMIDRVYTNSTDDRLYATLEAALEVYGHMLHNGRILPIHQGPATGVDTQYTYLSDSSDFHNGQDPNGRIAFDAVPCETAVLFFDPPPVRTTVYIGYTMLHGHQEAARAENKAARAKQESIAMAALAALPKQAYGILRDPEIAESIRYVLHQIEDNGETVPPFAGIADKSVRKNFIAFLKISFNLMGQYSEAERKQANEFDGD